MEGDQLVTRLLEQPHRDARRAFLRAQENQLNDDLVDALKERAIATQSANVHQALEIAQSIYDVAEITRRSLHQATALRMEAQIRAIELGQFEQALDLYDQAIHLHRACSDPLGEANVHVTRVWVLANLSRIEEALADGQRADDVLRERQQWRALARLRMNLASILGRRGEDLPALHMLDLAREAASQLGEAGRQQVMGIEQNRAIVLRNLGRYDESIAASEMALRLSQQLGHVSVSAQARQNLGLAYFILGRYNEGLDLLNQALDAFRSTGSERYAVLVELSIGECLLQLGRFADVLANSSRSRQMIQLHGTRNEIAQLCAIEGLAHAGLGHAGDAAARFDEAIQLCDAEGNASGKADALLQLAILEKAQGRLDDALAAASAAQAIYEQLELPYKTAYAKLISAATLQAAGRTAEASRRLQSARQSSAVTAAPSLSFLAHALCADALTGEARHAEALADYDHAIEALERLENRLMIEQRMDFLKDKQRVYEDAVSACLEIDLPQRAFHYAERAKSRSLVAMLARKPDLRLHAHMAEDQPLVDRLQALRAALRQLQRQGIEARIDTDKLGGLSVRDLHVDAEDMQNVQRIERAITETWHRLLIRNADYARNAALWQVRAEEVQPYLAENTCLIEYFAVHDQLIAFAVHRSGLVCRRLNVSRQDVLRWLQLMTHNFERATTSSRPHALEKNAQGLMQQLHVALWAPLVHDIAGATEVVIVPHEDLHRLPFACLFDGKRYLAEHYPISYLPSASVLRYCKPDFKSDLKPKGIAGAAVAIGHSQAGLLPGAVAEAREVAQRWGGMALLEQSASLASVKDAIRNAALIHFATHGQFRLDDPLFSGLALDDGLLTTWDVFDLQLNASLVTLSACLSGKNVIGGGDELLGLARAFLYAGARSLLVSQWRIEDTSAARFMSIFYEGLQKGLSKCAAVRQAQLTFLEAAGGSLTPAHRHPCFWGAYGLIGDAGPL
jgi:CHAT domain-containing protein